jgi:hypothetical protein
MIETLWVLLAADIFVMCAFLFCILKDLLTQWKRISRKQSTRWQHLSWLKASALFSFQKNRSYETQLVVKQCDNLYLGLVTPSSG